MFKDMLRLFWKDLETADSFKANWYGYATNQLSHILIGFLFAGLVSYCGFLLHGQFYYKSVIFCIVATLYVLVEASQTNQKNVLDSIEDTVFFVVYGAGSSILLFNEVRTGSSEVITNVHNILIVSSIVFTHLFVGISTRIYSKIKGEEDD